MKTLARLPRTFQNRVAVQVDAWRVTGLWLALALGLTGCGTVRETDRKHQVSEQTYRAQRRALAPELEAPILALDPEHVTAREVRDVLSHAPAPRILNIRGGTRLVYRRMVSFSEFLVGMGYPRASVLNPGDGRYALSCYESAETMAGMIAWYYAHEQLRPMLVGHSQGGMQAIKVLYRFAEEPALPIPLWNPFTYHSEETNAFTDPLTGKVRLVVGFTLPYVSVVGAGGLTRVLPNQWEMTGKLREIPDTVEEFTGFCKGGDLLGGDLLGYGSANLYSARGTAVVQNVWLPSSYSHSALPETKHLVQNPEIRAWLDEYQPSREVVSTPEPELPFKGKTDHILWAAEVWFRLKKHWVLELQRLARAQQTQRAQKSMATPATLHAR